MLALEYGPFVLGGRQPLEQKASVLVERLRTHPVPDTKGTAVLLTLQFLEEAAVTEGRRRDLLRGETMRWLAPREVTLDDAEGWIRRRGGVSAGGG
ncbi:MAG TPA: hypothetical protein VG126_18540 [Thermoleophilaceae bacterium]|nr:hypothetical protein [Thermoleophilaceae bacterium]